MNDVVSAFVGSFLWPIDLQPRIACHNLRYATDVIVMMVGQQNRVRRQIQAFQRIKYRLCLTGIDNDAVPLLVILQPNVIVLEGGNTDKIHLGPLVGNGLKEDNKS